MRTSPSAPGILAGIPSVPDTLFGCWVRRYIRFKDGSADTTTRVVWLQTLSGVADMRISADRPCLQSRGSLAECNRDELLALAASQDCFTGRTIYEADTFPYPTAKWPVEDHRIRFQPAVTFPEDGWMHWNADRTSIIERAPSGAYEEEWWWVTGSRTFAAHLTSAGGSLHVAGDHAIFARDRKVKLPADKTLLELARSAGNDDRLRELVDCEFSYARRRTAAGEYPIELSTLPWREGQKLDCAWVESLFPSNTVSEPGKTASGWQIESFWRNQLEP